MSRNPTDDDLLQRADRPDWWTPSWDDEKRMYTLRQALALALARPVDRQSRIVLFRAGGFGEAAVWLEYADIERLWSRLQSARAA